MISYWSILRILFSLIFTLFNIYITQFIKALEDKKNCTLSKGWRITNGKLLSSLLMIIGLVNIVIPANKFLSSLPLIGSSYVLLFSLALFSNLFIVNRLAINVSESESSKCQVKGYDMILNFFNNTTFTECMYYTVIVSVLFFYL